jgi:diguanylate cyclase (GGDEF)-like protein
MKLGIGKKLIGAHTIGFVFFLFLIIYSYITISSLLSIEKKSNDLANKIKLISDLQIFIQQLVMPANDYLITGDKKERENFVYLVTKISSTLANIKTIENKTEEETLIEIEVDKGFIELQQKIMGLITTENPVNNKGAAGLVEEMNAFANALTDKITKLHEIANKKMEHHSVEAFKIRKKTLNIYIFFMVILLSGFIFIIFSIMWGIVRPLLNLTNAVRVIGKGDLDYKVKVGTGDEIEILGDEFNNMAKSLKEKNEEIKALAITDGVTSLYNQRYFMERLNEEFERVRRYKRNLSLIMIDIDHFKKYNDIHEHPKGNEILKDVAEILNTTVRQSDTVARYTEEKFIIVLPETGIDYATALAERLRREVEFYDFPDSEIQPSGRITISLGVASYREDLKSIDDLIKNAGAALYRAKEAGRNRVCT